MTPLPLKSDSQYRTEVKCTQIALFYREEINKLLVAFITLVGMA